MKDLCVVIVLRLVGLTERFDCWNCVTFSGTDRDLCVGIVLRLVGLTERFVCWNCVTFSGTD
jgi:hypothetical protein